MSAYKAVKINTIENLGVQDSYDLIENVVNYAFNEVCPIVIVKSKHKGPTWSLRIVELKKKRANLFKNYKRTKNVSFLNICRVIDKTIKALMLKERKEKMHENLGNFNSSKSLWLGVKEILNHNNASIPEKIFNDGESYIGDDQQAEAFASFFHDKTEKIVNECIVRDTVYNGESILQIFDENFMTGENLDIVIKSCKKKKSYGYDLIPMIVIADLYDELKAVLLDLLNKIYLTKEIPEQMKIA
ncbi:MAG: hypothetical protein HQK53_18145, partial [Oligoflexia bacterium]|nr:hypothetical protein [Oligoflexia bacterium]